MSSKFLTFIFIILVSVQLSSCGWGFPWEKTESSTEKTTEKSFKDDEPNLSPAAPIVDDASELPLPKDPNVLSIDNNQDESSRGSSVQPAKPTLESVSAMPNEEFTKYLEEESSKFADSDKEIKSIPTTSTDSSDKIVNYVSSKTTQITNSSTPTTEESESESSTFDNTSTSTTTGNTLDGTDNVNNAPRNVDEDREDAKVTSSVISSSTVSNLGDNGFLNDTGISNSSEYTAPKVTYFNNSKDGSTTSDIDEETLTPTDRPTIGRIVPHSPREVNQSTDYSTQKITENYESGESTTDMTNAPTPTENTLNSTSNNEARNVINGTESSDNEDSKPEIIKDLDQSPSSETNTTIKTILSTSTNTMNTTEMAGSMSNGTTPEVNFGSFVNSGSTGNTNSQLILNLCILIFSISVIV